MKKLHGKKREKRRFRRVGRFYTYIVECNDGTYYTGYTPDIERRVKLHNAGRGAKYTRDRRPVKLIWFKEYRYFKPAFMEERRIKGLTRREKEVLIKKERKKMARHSPATRNLIRLAQLGKHNSMYGRHHRKETIERLSKNSKGAKNPMYGRHHSAATRRKIALAAKRRWA